MPNSQWSPYTEAENHLPDYDFFYKTDDLLSHFDHPQILEDHLFEMAHNQFCYGFCWTHLPGGIPPARIMYSFISVKDPAIATWIKLQTGLSPIDKSEYCIIMSIDNKWEMCLV